MKFDKYKTDRHEKVPTSPVETRDDKLDNCSSDTTKCNLVDSGARTTFPGGAKRELTDDKGRCDLLPMRIISVFLEHWDPGYFSSSDGWEEKDWFWYASRVTAGFYNVLRGINDGMYDEVYDDAMQLLGLHCAASYANDPYTMILEVAKHYQDGAKKYGDRNWEKGLPLWSCIDSAYRHFCKMMRGDTDEPHDRAYTWNLLAFLYMLDNKPSTEDKI